MTIDDFHKLVREIADELYRSYVPQTRIALLTRLIRANMETCTHPVTTPMTDEKGPISDCHKCEACHQVVQTVITTFPRTWTTKEGVVCSTSEPIPVGPPSGTLNLGLIPEHDIHEQGGTKLECPSCNRSDHDFEWSKPFDRTGPELINTCACGYRWRWKP